MVWRISSYVLVHAFLCFLLASWHCESLESNTACVDQSCMSSLKEIEQQELQEAEVAKLELLQSRALPTGVMAVAVTDPDSLRGPLRWCPRVDARRISPRDLLHIKEPTILEHAWEVLDNTSWAYEDFESDSMLGSIPNVSAYQGRNKKGSEYVYPTLSELVNEDKSTVTLIQQMGGNAEVVANVLASLGDRNGGVPRIGPISSLLRAMNYVSMLSLALDGQWTKMHTHKETLFTQVSGRRGWVFADSHAQEDIDDFNNPIGGRTRYFTEYFLQDDVCGLYKKNIVPAGIKDHPANFRMCETKPGESIFWPGLCDGSCGWWHTDCALGFSAAFSHLGFDSEFVASNTPYSK